MTSHIMLKKEKKQAQKQRERAAGWLKGLGFQKAEKKKIDYPQHNSYNYCELNN